MHPLFPIAPVHRLLAWCIGKSGCIGSLPAVLLEGSERHVLGLMVTGFQLGGMHSTQPQIPLHEPCRELIWDQAGLAHGHTGLGCSWPGVRTEGSGLLAHQVSPCPGGGTGPGRSPGIFCPLRRCSCSRWRCKGIPGGAKHLASNQPMETPSPQKRQETQQHVGAMHAAPVGS